MFLSGCYDVKSVEESEEELNNITQTDDTKNIESESINSTVVKSETISTEITEQINTGYIENIVSPWTEDDINQAWSTSWFAENYYNRCFIDFDNDGIPELVLTSEIYYGVLFIYKKDLNEIIQIPFNNDIDTLNLHSIFGIPPTKEVDFVECDIYSMEDFIIISAPNGNYYLSGISSTDGITCFIKQIYYENNKINVSTIYRWGYFKNWYTDDDGNSQFDYVYSCIKYTNNDLLNEPEPYEVVPEEIEEFLKYLYGDEYE